VRFYLNKYGVVLHVCKSSSTRGIGERFAVRGHYLTKWKILSEKQTKTKNGSGHGSSGRALVIKKVSQNLLENDKGEGKNMAAQVRHYSFSVFNLKGRE
jgi:hypothetical protein